MSPGVCVVRDLGLGYRDRTTNLYGGLQLQQNRLIDENFTGFGAEIFDLVLLELNRLSGSISSYWIKHCKRSFFCFEKIGRDDGIRRAANERL